MRKFFTVAVLSLITAFTVAALNSLYVRADGINIPAPLYLQGPWTPAIAGVGTAGTGQTYTTQEGTYEQFGRTVIARFNLIVAGVGTAAGQVLITGLPVANVTGAVGHCFVSGYSVSALTASNWGIGGTIASGATQTALVSFSNTGQSVVTIAQSGATPFFQGVCIYRAS